MSRLYACIIDAIAVTAVQDLFEIATPATTGAVIHAIYIGQSSDFGDAQAEGLRVRIIRGHTTTGSGGAAVTPARLTTGGAAASSTVARNNTTVATGGTPVTLHADAWNIQAGWQYIPTPESRIRIAPSSRIVVNLPAAPADEITLSATLVYEELN